MLEHKMIIPNALQYITNKEVGCVDVFSRDGYH